MVWSEEAIAELKRLAADGCSASEIGAVLNVSRNAVIGKEHRLGIFKSTGDIKRAKAHKESPRRRPGARDAGKPMKIERGATYIPQQSPPGAPTQSIELEPDTSAQAIPMTEANFNQCHWPVGDGKVFMVCGAKTATVGPRIVPYCPRHRMKSAR